MRQYFMKVTRSMMQRYSVGGDLTQFGFFRQITLARLTVVRDIFEMPSLRFMDRRGAYVSSLMGFKEWLWVNQGLLRALIPFPDLARINLVCKCQSLFRRALIWHKPQKRFGLIKLGKPSKK